jgi:hypothetical protein
MNKFPGSASRNRWAATSDTGAGYLTQSGSEAACESRRNKSSRLSPFLQPFVLTSICMASRGMNSMGTTAPMHCGGIAYSPPTSFTQVFR